MCHVVEEDTREVCVRETILRHHWESVPPKGQRLHVPLRRRKRFLRRRRGIERSLSHSLSSLFSSNVSTHRTDSFPTVLPTFVPSSIFVNRERKREREKERNFSFDTSPWRSISPSTRLFSSSTFLYFVCRAFWTELIRDNRCSFTMSLLFFFYIVGQKLKKFY